MLFDLMRPYLSRLPDTQQKIIRHLYETRFTRPYVAAMMGISNHQVLIEEVGALRLLIEIMGTKPTPSRASKAIGTKQKRVPAGPSDAE